MAVQDASRFRVQAGNRAHRRLKPENLGSSQRLKRYAIARRPLGITGQRRQLRRVGSDQQLAESAMRDVAFRAVAIEEFLAAHAQGRLQGILGVVEAGVYDFRVARGRLRAESSLRFQNEHLAPGQCQRSGNRQTDHSSPYHNGINGFQQILSVSQTSLGPIYNDAAQAHSFIEKHRSVLRPDRNDIAIAINVCGDGAIMMFMSVYRTCLRQNPPGPSGACRRASR